jgi:hypothetical protein
MNHSVDDHDELGTEDAGGRRRHQREDGRRPSMNHSIYSADRTTHLKIVVVALVAGVALAGFGISARSGGSDEGFAQTARVIKAGKPVMLTNSDASLVR